MATTSLGITISVWKPRWIYVTSGVEALMTPELHELHVKDLEQESVLSYSHTISDSVGYDTATFELSLNALDLERWFIEGIGYHVEVRDEAATIIWEGFVNEVSLSMGAYKVSRGPLTEIANRVYMVYQGIDTSTAPPTYGVRMKTTPSIHPASQENWGVYPVVITASGTTAAAAAWMRDMYQTEHAYPALRKEYGGGGVSNISINCLGYAHRMTYPYTDLSSSTIALSTKLQYVTNMTPNLMYTWKTITANTMLVPRYEASEGQANAIIKELVALGDSTGARYTFGCWAGRMLVYEPASTIIDYEQRLGDEQGRIFRKAGGEVRPWNVLPGKWIEFTDFLPGFTLTGTYLRMNPRCMYIERTTFTAPYTVQLSGGDTDLVSRKLGQFGLSGR